MPSQIRTEKGLEDALKKWLQGRPECHFFKVWGGPYQDPHQPDICMGWLGRYVAIELKTPGRLGHKISIVLPSPKDVREIMQQRKIDDMLAKGSIAFFSDDLQATQDLLLSLPGVITNDWLYTLDKL